jgi:hypothetical protein
VPVEGLPGDTKLGAELANVCLGLAHRRHRESHLPWCHRERPTAHATAGPRGREAGDGAL